MRTRIARTCCAVLGASIYRQSENLCLQMEDQERNTVIVVGGGVSGVSTALQLARMGHKGRIIVLEREKVRLTFCLHPVPNPEPNPRWGLHTPLQV